MSLKEVILSSISGYELGILTVTAITLLILYLGGNVIYQLYFSPLSIFPGPKLAAATLWYEIYYDVFKWGRYYIKVREMHERYVCLSGMIQGPIVRINPFELHVSDPDFIDTLYTRSAPRDKHSYMTGQFGNPLVTFSTDGHSHHRIRRAALNPFFSKQRVLGLQDLIWTHVDKLCARFEEFKQSGRPLPTGPAFGCLTADVIIEYSMGHKQNALDDPAFAPLFTQAVKKFASMSVFTKHMPWLHTVMRGLPQHWIANMSPEYGAMLAFRALNNQRVKEVFMRNGNKNEDGGGNGNEIKDHPTVFHELLNSDLPPSERSLERLSQESQLIVGAALDTTAHALNTTLFHLLANPQKLQKLKAELKTAIPSPHIRTPLTKLENLPYLSACISEGLRLSHGISTRNARLAHTPMQYGPYTIPAFTPVGMSAPLTHHNETLFPSSHSFIPERWIGGKAPDGRPLEKYLMAFGRGARQCAGINLARAEMYVVLAALVKRFELEVWESSRSDVDMQHDLFLPQAELGSRGVWVLVR